MYNKLFTKILDSSIWLETSPTRIVWLTFLAVMDEKGFAPFAAVGNVANRARVTLEEAREACAVLEAPDPESSDPENEGRRLERVPGGWIVINAEKHRDLVTRAIKQVQTAERVRRFRERVKRERNAQVTTSEAYSEARSEEKHTQQASSMIGEVSQTTGNGSRVFSVPINGTTDPKLAERAGRFCERYAELYPLHRKGARYLPKPALDWPKAVDLCATWDDARLEKLAIVFLKTDHDFAVKGSRTIGQFAALASWCDDRLREVESGGQ